MAIDKLPEKDDSIPTRERERAPIDSESDSEYDDDDIPELEEFSGHEYNDQTTAIRRLPGIGWDSATVTDRVNQALRSYEQDSRDLAMDIRNFFHQSFYDPAFDPGAEPQPDNVIRRLMTSEGGRGYMIRFNRRATLINDRQVREPWTWPTYGTASWRLSFAGGRRAAQELEQTMISLREISTVACDLALLILLINDRTIV